MQRTRMVPGIGEINPESAADTMSVLLWASIATGVFKLHPGAVGLFLGLEWYLMIGILTFTIAICFFVVQVPLSLYGLIYEDGTGSLLEEQ